MTVDGVAERRRQHAALDLPLDSPLRGRAPSLRSHNALAVVSVLSSECGSFIAALRQLLKDAYARSGAVLARAVRVGCTPQDRALIAAYFKYQAARLVSKYGFTATSDFDRLSGGELDDIAMLPL